MFEEFLQLPKKGDELLDVLIFIHGGGFMFGDGHSQFPDYIMNDHDIVYVSLNYRLGILGESPSDYSESNSLLLKDS